MHDDRLRHDLIKTAQTLNQKGLNNGTAGNVSVRSGLGYLITPSGMSAEELAPADLVRIDFNGTMTGSRAPSSEWRFHDALLRNRPDLGAVVHTHAPYCTTLAVIGCDIPAFHYMVAVAGGDTIRCAPYATFGTQALCNNVLKAMENRRACLMAQHGMLAASDSLAAALKLTIEVEDLARIYWQALQIGHPPVLDAAEMERVLEKFRTYGKPQPVL